MNPTLEGNFRPMNFGWSWGHLMRTQMMGLTEPPLTAKLIDTFWTLHALMPFEANWVPYQQKDPAKACQKTQGLRLHTQRTELSIHLAPAVMLLLGPRHMWTWCLPDFDTPWRNAATRWSDDVYQGNECKNDHWIQPWNVGTTMLCMWCFNTRW